MSRNPPPPQQNTNNGRNEYIPQYISAKPFYAEDLLKDTEYLSHQRSKAEQKDTLDKAKWYSRGRTTGPAATKFRKGACENCGAMTHKTKECLSRPRKQGAKWTGRNIQADEVVEDVKLGWDAKRDRWNGYDVRQYDSVIKDYEEMEGLRKVAASKSPLPDGEGEQGDVDVDVDGDHYAEETDMGRNQPTSTRQLRLREDTAKYLLDLNLDSAKYDPKTRSMDTTAQSLNSNPNPNSNSASADLASEGFIRPSHDPRSDAAAFERAQRYAWETQEKPITANAPTPAAQIGTNDAPSGGSKVHLEANPTASALAHKQALTAATAKKAQQKSYLLDKYGDTSTLTTKKPLTATSTSAYVTYDPATGREIDQATGKPMLKPVARSKYPEDIHPGNHTSVFGSYWRDGQWGYTCCHSFVKNSYCTGEEGRRGFEEEEAQRLGRNLIAERADEDRAEDAEEIAFDSKKRKAVEDGNDEGGGEAQKRSRTEEPS
ncbi:mRNA splicing protein [Exophiala xenobiotica]|uniref:Pre-mRNA-splicing factor SLU7 n=1 Tax=Lithohypha guttulata TaxID=1690604 RepID=A0ABR0K6M4_9EURO|nr:mRNA splicing protein [Lithohypha guttulata]KAK5324320.1 mRNA splicing protein [Exophiala xenobiotica]